MHTATMPSAWEPSAPAASKRSPQPCLQHQASGVNVRQEPLERAAELELLVWPGGSMRMRKLPACIAPCTGRSPTRRPPDRTLRCAVGSRSLARRPRQTAVVGDRVVGHRHAVLPSPTRRLFPAISSKSRGATLHSLPARHLGLTSKSGSFHSSVRLRSICRELPLYSGSWWRTPPAKKNMLRVVGGGTPPLLGQLLATTGVLLTSSGRGAAGNRTAARPGGAEHVAALRRATRREPRAVARHGQSAGMRPGSVPRLTASSPPAAHPGSSRWSSAARARPRAAQAPPPRPSAGAHIRSLPAGGGGGGGRERLVRGGAAEP